MVTFEWVGFLRPSFHPSPPTKWQGSERRGPGNAFCPCLGANGANETLSRDACRGHSYSQDPRPPTATPKPCSGRSLSPPLAPRRKRPIKDESYPRLRAR